MHWLLEFPVPREIDMVYRTRTTRVQTQTNGLLLSFQMDRGGITFVTVDISFETS